MSLSDQAVAGVDSGGCWQDSQHETNETLPCWQIGCSLVKGETRQREGGVRRPKTGAECAREDLEPERRDQEGTVLWGEAAQLVSCRGRTPIPALLLNSCVTLGGRFFSRPAFKQSSVTWEPGDKAHTVAGRTEVAELGVWRLALVA